MAWNPGVRAEIVKLFVEAQLSAPRRYWLGQGFSERERLKREVVEALRLPRYYARQRMQRWRVPKIVPKERCACGYGLHTPQQARNHARFCKSKREQSCGEGS